MVTALGLKKGVKKCRISIFENQHQTIRPSESCAIMTDRQARDNETTVN